MSWKRTIFAGLAFVLVCMALFLDMTISARRIYEQVNAASLAKGVNVSEVGEILLKNPHGKVRLVRTGAGWRMTEPVEAPADSEIVETLLINVTAARRTNENEARNLAEYGLANPEIELTLLPVAGKQFKGEYPEKFGLQLGHESTYTGLVFAKYPGERTVFTVGEQVKNTAMRAPLDFRRARLFEIDSGDLEKYTTLAVRGRETPLVLRNEVGRWKMTSPVELPAEPGAVREYLNRLGLLRAAGFLTQASDKPTSMAAAVQALTSPTLSVTLEEGTALQSIVVARAEGLDGPVYVAQRPGENEIMTLRQETVEDLRPSPQQFRSRELFTLQPEDVGLFTIGIGRATTALILNDQGNWEVVGDPDFRVDQQAVNDRLQSLLGMKIREYLQGQSQDLSVYGLQPPLRTYTVVSKDRSRTEVLETGRSETGQGTVVFARRGGQDEVFTVELSGDLNIFAGSIADRNFARTEPGAIVRMELDVDGQTYVITRDEGEWKLLRPGQTAPATADVRNVESLLRSLNSMAYERDLTGTGQTVIAPRAGPPLAVRLYGERDRDLLEMNVTKRLGNTTLVVTGGGRTFEVPSQDIDRLYAAAQALVR